MRQVIFSVPRIGFLILLALSGGTQSTALAEGNLNHHLRGDYRASWSASCVGDSIGFDNNLKALSGASITSLPITFAGLFHYYGDGTGTVELKRLVFVGGTQPIFEAFGNCSLTYTVNADGTFTQTLDCTSTILKGVAPPGITQTITETGMRLDGTLGANFRHHVLALQTTDPVQFVFSRTLAPPTPTLVQKRICGFTGSAVHIRLDE